MLLKWWLIKNNMESKEFAKKALVSNVYFSRIKNGKIKTTIKTATLISQATNGEVSVDEIINPNNYPDPF